MSLVGRSVSAWRGCPRAQEVRHAPGAALAHMVISQRLELTPRWLLRSFFARLAHIARARLLVISAHTSSVMLVRDAALVHTSTRWKPRGSSRHRQSVIVNTHPSQPARSTVPFDVSSVTVTPSFRAAKSFDRASGPRGDSPRKVLSHLQQCVLTRSLSSCSQLRVWKQRRGLWTRPCGCSS